jgi:hypothetical protein
MASSSREPCPICEDHPRVGSKHYATKVENGGHGFRLRDYFNTSRTPESPFRTRCATCYRSRGIRQYAATHAIAAAHVWYDHMGNDRPPGDEVIETVGEPEPSLTPEFFNYLVSQLTQARAERDEWFEKAAELDSDLAALRLRSERRVELDPNVYTEWAGFNASQSETATRKGVTD